MGPSRGPFAVARASAPPPVIVPVIAAVEPAAASAATAGGGTAVATLSTRASEAAATAAAATAEPSAAASAATAAGATAAPASAATAASIEPAAATAAAREASSAPAAASVAATATPTTVLSGWQRELVVARSAPTRHGTVLVGRELEGRAALAASLRARALTTVASASERGASTAAHPSAAEARGSPGATPHPWLDQGEREGLAALGALTDHCAFLVLAEGQRRSAGPAATGGSWLGFLFAIFTLLVLIVVIVIIIIVGPGLGSLAAGPGGLSVLRVGLRFRVLVVVISRSVGLALRSRPARGLLVRALFQPRQLPFLFAHRHFIPTALARPYDVPVRVEGEAQLRPALRADLGHGRSPPARTLKGEGRARATIATLRNAG